MTCCWFRRETTKSLVFHAAPDSLRGTDGSQERSALAGNRPRRADGGGREPWRLSFRAPHVSGPKAAARSSAELAVPSGRLLVLREVHRVSWKRFKQNRFSSCTHLVRFNISLLVVRAKRTCSAVFGFISSLRVEKQ